MISGQASLIVPMVFGPFVASALASVETPSLSLSQRHSSASVWVGLMV
jgi:hypothetical protein